MPRGRSAWIEALGGPPTAQGREQRHAASHAAVNARHFATVLRDLRIAAGLTQRELGQRAALSERAIRDLERGKVARPRQDTIEVLATALGLDGIARDVFADAARRRGVTRPWWAVQPALVGRDADVVDVAMLLAEGSPLVTLVGVAGVGKTAVAMAVAAQVALDYPGGVAFVPVAEAASARALAEALAHGLGARQAEQLDETLAGRRALVVLDGVERSWEAARNIVAWLSRSTSGTRVLVTSRSVIATAGERTFVVRPLAVPARDTEAEHTSRYPAAQLFLERLRRVRIEPLSRREMVAVADLVRRLDGLPLALEFAAARGRMLTVEEILQRYADGRLELGGTYGTETGRTVTLKDAIADTYESLPASDRQALSAMSVFRAPWPARYAERLLDGAESLAIVERLSACGLINESNGEERRFRLLDAIRDVATEHADEDVLVASKDRHAAMFAEVAEELPSEPVGIDAVAADLVAALPWAATRNTSIAVRIAASLVPHWRTRGSGREGRDALARMLAIGGDRLPGHVVARARHGLAVLATDDGDMWTALADTRRALAEYRAIADVDGELAARGQLVDVLHSVGDYDEARHHAHAAIEVARRTGRVDPRLTLATKLIRDDIRSGALDVARERLSELRQEAARRKLAPVLALIDRGLGEVARLAGRSDESEQRNLRALLELRRLGDDHSAVPTLCALVKVRAFAGRPKDAQPALDEARMIAARLRTSRIEGAVDLAAGYHNLAQGERQAADRCFSALLVRGTAEPRDVLEAHLGLALARAADAERADRALADLADASRRLGFVLCVSERARLVRAGLRLDQATTVPGRQLATAART